MNNIFLKKQYEYKAKLFEDEKKSTLSISCLIELCKLDPTKENFFRLGHAYYINDDIENALFYFRKAYRMGYTNTLTLIGLLELRKDKEKEAINTFIKGQKEGVKDALFGLFLIAKKRGDIDKQKEYLMNVVENCDSDEYPLILSDIYYKEKDYANFIKYAEISSLRGSETANYRLACYYLFEENDFNKFIDYISNCHSDDYVFIFLRFIFDFYRFEFDIDDMCYLFKCIGYNGNYMACLYAAYIMAKQNKKESAMTFLKFARDYSKDQHLINEMNYLINNPNNIDYISRLEALIKIEYNNEKYINSSLN
ncbi:MAG: hypothetical protein PUA56_00825 [Bacillales bacterium]|nr:hypothetical protein [Bacillales bacterium]